MFDFQGLNDKSQSTWQEKYETLASLEARIHPKIAMQLNAMLKNTCYDQELGIITLTLIKEGLHLEGGMILLFQRVRDAWETSLNWLERALYSGHVQLRAEW